MRLIFLIYFITTSLYSQDFKNDISIVQFSAGFVKDSEIKLTPFKVYNIYYFTMEERAVLFKEENIKYLPTVVLYHNGKEITRVESGIDLKLPENCIELINKHINKLIEDKF
ncbi:MAG: hypothetical protein Unbinned306contig1002_31 [Prokaryotic dsDNA virus sp.]|nr:MAG: hypothetical protein Unbinned306contig1002_31 [Prokaryotic dsDNA virus sp.]|tara:strand:- start:14156 stop:14491 length:336 start_codon:yes stop_codon:yes gene_type:complete